MKMKQAEYVQYDGIGLEQLIANKEVKAEEVLEASFTQLEKVNPILNAMTSIRKEQAFAEVAQGRAGVFANVPTALKDISQTIAGEPSTAGSALLQGTPA